MIDYASIITALGTIILGYFTYNQYTKNKFTDAKLENMRMENERREREESEKSKRRNDNVMIIYGELWNALYALGAARVYIVQPHPLGREEMLSVVFEVKKKGVEAMKSHIQELKISDVASFSSELVKKKYMYISDIDKQIEDRYARSILSSFGCESAIIRRLANNEHDWVGSIFCEFTQSSSMSESDAQELLSNAATNIQYILPEIRK